jgi:hypothetical protein
MTTINWFMLFEEIIAVYSENHTKHKNTLCGQNTKLHKKHDERKVFYLPPNQGPSQDYDASHCTPVRAVVVISGRPEEEIHRMPWEQVADN